MPSPEFGNITLTIENIITYTECSNYTLPSFVDYVNRTERIDEQVFVEFDLSGAPNDTSIFLNGIDLTQDMANFDGVWLLVPADDPVALATLTIANFCGATNSGFSGTFNMTTRATLREAGVVASESESEVVVVNVLPLAQCSVTNSVIADEDQVAEIEWGRLFNDALVPLDNGFATGSGNNPDPETYIQFEITLPADTPTYSYNVADSTFGTATDGAGFQPVGAGTALLRLVGDGNSTDRVYTIRSSIRPEGEGASETQLLALTRTELQTIDTDIRAVLDDLRITIGPEHTDEDGAIGFSATSADVNYDVLAGVGAADIRTCSVSGGAALTVRAIADDPTLDIVDPSPATVLEDEDNIPLCIQAYASADNSTLDNSEVLSVRLTIPIQPLVFPVPSSSAIGEIIYNGVLPAGVTISNQAEGVWLIEATGPDPITRENRLNSALCADPANPSTSLLLFDPRFGFAGVENILVEAITTEQATGNQVAQKTATVAANLTVSIDPLADPPDVEVKGNAIGKEDVSAQLLHVQM